MIIRLEASRVRAAGLFSAQERTTISAIGSLEISQKTKTRLNMSKQWPFKHMICYPLSPGFENEEAYIKRFNAYHGQDSGGNRVTITQTQGVGLPGLV